jgi:hypothetical protein
MDFFKFIQSLDEMLFEIVSWLLFYPVTLWRMIRSPLAMMASAATELGEADERQFDDVIAPPLFLLLTLLLLHFAELGFLGRSYLEVVHPELSRQIGTDANLILFRIVMIAILPLTAALRLIRARGMKLDRQALKAPFYAQCYAASLFTLLLSLSLAVAGPAVLVDAGAAGRYLVPALSLLWLYIIETIWFSTRLHSSLLRGLGQATILMVQWALLLVIVFTIII